MRIDNDERYKAKCLESLSSTLIAVVEYGYFLGVKFAQGKLDNDQVTANMKMYVNKIIKELSQ